MIRSAGGIDGSGDFDATDTIRVTRDGNGTGFQTAGDPRQPADLIGDWIWIDLGKDRAPRIQPVTAADFDQIFANTIEFI